MVQLQFSSSGIAAQIVGPFDPNAAVPNTAQKTSSNYLYIGVAIAVFISVVVLILVIKANRKRRGRKKYKLNR